MLASIRGVLLSTITLLAITGYVNATNIRLGFQPAFCEYGMAVVDVHYGSLASQIGLLPGDIIVQINEHKIDCFDTYFRALDDAAFNHAGHVEMWFYHPGVAGFELLYVEFTIYQEQILVHVPCCVHPIKCHDHHVHCWRDRLPGLNIWFNKHCHGDDHHNQLGQGLGFQIGKLPGIKLGNFANKNLLNKQIEIGQQLGQLNGFNGLGHRLQNGNLNGWNVKNLQQLDGALKNRAGNLNGIRLNNLQNLQGIGLGNNKSNGHGGFQISNQINQIKKLNRSNPQFNSGNNGGMNSLRKLSGSGGSNGSNSSKSFKLNFGKR